MKNKSKIRSRLISSIKVILAVGAMIAICTLFSKTNHFYAYGENIRLYGVTASKTEETDTESNGISSSYLQSKLSKIKFVVSGSTTASSIDDTIDGVSSYATDIVIDNAYVETKSEKQIIKCTGTLKEGSKGTDTYVFNNEITVTFNVTVAASTYTFDSLINPDEDYIFPNGTKAADITKTLQIRIPKVGVNVKEGTTLEEWGDCAEVTWTGLKSGSSYDPSKKEKQTITWVGTVEKGDVSCEGSNVNIPSDQTAEVSVIVESDLDNYDNIEEGTMSGDYDDDDLGKIKATLSKSTVKKILKNQEGTIATVINDAVASGDSLSITVNVEELDKDDVDDDIIDKFKDKADAKLGTICDIKLFLVVDGKTTKHQITDTGTTISFTHTIPSDLKRSSSTSNGKTYKRKYREYRYHGDSVHSCDEDWSDSTSSVKFKSSEFSYFALMYKDSETSSSSTSSSSRTGSSSIASARTTTTGGTSSGNAAGGSKTGSGAPKTGDEFNAKLWIYFLVVGVVVALCAFILYQDTKDWRDEKKEAK